MSSLEQTVGADVCGGTPPSCSLCGSVADPRTDGDPPLGWSADMIETSEGTRPRWVCPTCTRRFVRSIEAKLDQQWW
ncbi:hypothetical protein [uncultured Jatrophihabitans sp.]|uniref:hypothetical protein n=1 Tax=uncultured Jatrophihabitans sp. TaxID=1610747 RepID=UPI0035CA1D15